MAEVDVMISVPAMKKEVCCINLQQLLDYVEQTPNLGCGQTGIAAVGELLNGIVDNPQYLIQDPDNSGKCYPVKEIHLRDKRYWLSMELQRHVYANAIKIIGGYRPLFQAGIIAGYRIMQSAQPKRFQFMRLFSPRRPLQLVSAINGRFNKNKSPKTHSYKDGHARVELHYSPEYKGQITKEFCDWNAGIYSGIGKYAGAHDIEVKEIECLAEGGNDCVFEITWAHYGFWRRLQIFLHSITDPDYIKERDLDNLRLKDLAIRQEGIIAKRTEQYRVEKERAEELLLELSTAYETLKTTQEELVRNEVSKAEKESELRLEKVLSGGLAHEARNGLQPGAFQVQRLEKFHGGLPSLESLSAAVAELDTTLGGLAETMFALAESGKIAEEGMQEALLQRFGQIETQYNRIQGALQSLSVESGEIAQALPTIKNSIGKGLVLAQQFLDYSKTQDVHRGLGEVDLAALVTQTLELLSDSGISCALHREEGDYTLQGDYLQLESIVKNLVLNARDALVGTEDKRIDIYLRRYASPQGAPHIALRVTDNGEGIAEDKQAKIFTPFYSTKPSSGVGLGLSLVKRLVEAYGGQIWFESAPDKGTTFIVDLPVTG